MRIKKRKKEIEQPENPGESKNQENTNMPIDKSENSEIRGESSIKYEIINDDNNNNNENN